MQQDAELLYALEGLIGADSVLDFIPRVNRLYERPDHLRPLAELVVRASRHQNLRAGVSVPVRHGKTETWLTSFVWLLLRDPTFRIAYVTYEATRAWSKSAKARQLAVQCGILLSRDTNTKGEWRTPQGGGVFATGVGGPLTGEGFDLIVVDDPIKNRKEAESPVIRDSIQEWFTSTALTRLEPGGSVVVNMARWHPDDLIGRLEDDKEIVWSIVNLPAIDRQGKALWPSRWSAAILDERRRLVGPYDWASLYQGAPRRKGGQLFEGQTLWTPANSVLLGRYRLGMACDPAATERESADHSAIVVGAAKGHGIDQVVDILHAERHQISMPRLAKRLVALQKHWGCKTIVETAGGFKGVPQMMRDLDRSMRVIEIQPIHDKHVRSQPVAAAWEDGRVRVPAQAHEWKGPFLKELHGFTGIGDAEDDQVDGLAHLFNQLNRTGPPSTRGRRVHRAFPFG